MPRRMRERTPLGRTEAGSGSMASGPLLDRAGPRDYAAAVEKARPAWFSPALPRFRPAAVLTGARAPLPHDFAPAHSRAGDTKGRGSCSNRFRSSRLASPTSRDRSAFMAKASAGSRCSRRRRSCFYQMNGLMLGTWLGSALEADMQRSLARPGAFSLAHNVLAQRDVQPLLDRLAAHGGRLLRAGRCAAAWRLPRLCRRSRRSCLGDRLQSGAGRSRQTGG